MVDAKREGDALPVRGIVRQLVEGDEVVVNDRSRALTVADVYLADDREPYRCNARIVEFEGNGTTYTLELPVSRPRGPRINWPSRHEAVGKVVSSIELVDRDVFITAEKTADDFGIPER